MSFDELKLRLERIFVERWDVYSESPSYLEDKEKSARQFSAQLAKASGKEVDFEEPRNINNYYRLQICLKPGLPANRFELDFAEIERAGSVIYFNIICSMIAPVSEASWHVYRVEHDQLTVDSYDLLDRSWLTQHAELETLALEVIRIGEETNLCVLAWDVTRQPADPRWPAPQFAPPQPQLRHFLFSGYYDE